MKTPVFPLLALCVVMFSFSGQNATCWKVSEGQVFTVNSESWVNSLPMNPKWAKMKPAQKEEQINEFNQAIIDGKKGDFGGPTDFKVEKVGEVDGMGAVHLVAMTDAYKYETVNYCNGDTTYLIRQARPVYSVYQGDTLGFTIYGVQKIPVKLQVGDVIPPYMDFTLMTPKTWTTEMKEKVLSFSYTTTEYESFGFGQDNAGNYGWGPIEKRVQHDVYDLISHEIQVTEQINNVTINNAVAIVTGTEEMTIGGEKVTAYIIESEQWTKQEVVRDYHAEKQSIADQAKKDFEKLQEKIDKKMVKIFPKNELGYMVVFKVEYFVPGYGIVKSFSHDAHGAIQSRMTVNF